MSQFSQYEQCDQASQTGNGVLAPASAYSAQTLTPAQVAAITGEAAPTLMWRMNEATGATELVSGTDNLTEVATPSREVADSALGGLVTEFSLGSTDALVSAGSSVGDVGAETVTLIVGCRLTDNLNGGTKAIMGNRSNVSPYNGYQLAARLGYFKWTCDGPTYNPVREIAIDHGTVNPQMVCATRSTAGTPHSGIWSREGSQDSAASTGTDTLTNSELFSIGDDPFGVSAGVNVAVAMLWIGTDGDFSDYGAARLALAEALGWE